MAQPRRGGCCDPWEPASSPARRVRKSRATRLRESAGMTGLLWPPASRELGDHAAGAEKGKREGRETQVALCLRAQASCPPPVCLEPVPLRSRSLL